MLGVPSRRNKDREDADDPDGDEGGLDNPSRDVAIAPVSLWRLMIGNSTTAVPTLATMRRTSKTAPGPSIVDLVRASTGGCNWVHQSTGPGAQKMKKAPVAGREVTVAGSSTPGTCARRWCADRLGLIVWRGADSLRLGPVDRGVVGERTNVGQPTVVVFA